MEMENKTRETVFGYPPEETIGKVLPAWQRFLLGLLFAAVGAGMFALVLWTLEKIFFME